MPKLRRDGRLVITPQELLSAPNTNCYEQTLLQTGKAL